MKAEIPSSAPSITRRAFGLMLGAAALGATQSAANTSDAAATFPKFSRGINLHHLLNWPDTVDGKSKTEYVLPPFAAENYKISDEELARLKTFGFDFLRVTADPSILIALKGAPAQAVTEHVLKTLKRLLGAGFKVIFDLHPVNVNPDYAPLKLVERADCPAFKAYADLVERMARTLHDFPHDQFAFELMNEPWLEGKAGIAQWQPMMELLHKRARAGSPTLPLILTGAAWSDPKALMQLDLKPFAGSNVIYTIHYYDPHTYTHQGVESDEGAYLAGLQWPASHENIATVRGAALARISKAGKPADETKAQTNMTTKLLADFELTAHNANRVHSDFAAVAKWASDHGIPKGRIFLGEFGCVASSHGIPLGPDRIEWFKTIRQTAEEFGFPWALWAYKGYGGMALFEKGVLDEGIVKGLGLPQ